MLDTELAKYGAYGIAIAALSLCGWLVNKFLAAQSAQTQAHLLATAKMEQAHQVSNTALQKSIEANTLATQETFAYLKIRNGSGDRLMREVADKLDRNYEIGIELNASNKVERQARNRKGNQ